MPDGSASATGFWTRLRRWLAALFAGEEPVGSASPPAAWPDLEGVRAGDEEDVQRAKRVLDRRLEDDFRRSLREPVRALRLGLSSVTFFGDTAWELHPSMNLLLGRNGYGKSLLLRTLAGMLQRDEDATQDLFALASPKAQIDLDLLRAGERESTGRVADIFLGGSAGKVPLLAIPDSRSPDRSSSVVADPGAQNLAYAGASDFLARNSYQASVDGLLAGLAIDYWQNGGSFEIPSFALLANVMAGLTGDAFKFVEVERVGRTGSRIWVRSEGLERPLAIKEASQGTLSVLTMFGLIYAFLEELAAVRDGDVATAEQSAIVLIDEVDAHLHPSWQRRIRDLLTETFPNVQFVLSAHSPLVVAGCGIGEVAVLRKPGDGGFVVERVLEDFVGATSPELLPRLFEIDDRDPVFLAYANKEDRGEGDRIRDRADALSAKKRAGRLSAKESAELDGLLVEAGRFSAVADIRERERKAQERALELEVELAQLRRKVSLMEAGSPPR
jgi:hypothetical protein